MGIPYEFCSFALLTQIGGHGKEDLQGVAKEAPVKAVAGIVLQDTYRTMRTSRAK